MNYRLGKKCRDCGKDISDNGIRCKHCASIVRMAHLFPQPTIECLNCGKDMKIAQRLANTRKFCSRECQKKYYFIPCLVCGKIFRPDRINGKPHYCSRECFAKYHRNRPRPHMHRRIELTCEYCGKNFKRRKSIIKGEHQFCSTECYHSYSTGINNGFYNSVECTCGVCGTIFKREYSKVLKGGGKYCSRACSSRSQIKDGCTGYRGPNWKEQRRKARYRDKYICKYCGKTEIENGVKLSVHHIIPFNDFGVKRYEEANHLSNLVSLCNICHRKVEKGKIQLE